MYLTFHEWKLAADAALLAAYGINYDDAGAGSNEMTTAYRCHLVSGTTVQEEARMYGEDMDLITPDPWTAKSLQEDHPIPPSKTPDVVLVLGDEDTDPNYGTAPLLPGEGFFSGSGGTVCFDLTTGDVTRHFPGMDWPIHHEGYFDVVRVDIKRMQDLHNQGQPYKDGACFDVITVPYWTRDGVFSDGEVFEGGPLP